MGAFLKRILRLGLLFILSILVGLVLIALSTNLTLKLEQKSFGHMTHWGSSWERITEFEKWATSPSAKSRGLIIGSSTAYRNLNPYIFESHTAVNWFNYGSSGQSPAISLTLLQHAFERCHFNYVVFDIYGPVVQLEGLESAHDLIYNSKLDFWLKTKLVCGYPEGKLWLRYLYFYTKQLVPSSAYVIEDPKNGTYLKKGFVCSNQPALKQYKKAPKRYKVPDFPELYEIAALCKAHGAKLILNFTPQLGKIQKLHPAYKSFYQMKHPEFCARPDLFYDTSHMTCEGANLYSEQVAQQLKKHATPSASPR